MHSPSLDDAQAVTNGVIMNPFIEKYRIHLRAAGYSAITVADRLRLLYQAHEQLPYGLVAANTVELAAWLASTEWSQWTRCTYHQHIRAFYRWAAGGDSPRIDHDPSAGLQRPKSPRSVPDPVTDKELAEAYARSSEWWRRIILLAAYAGLRASEIARLRRESVTAERIHIVKGKGGKDAHVPTHPRIWAAVEPLPAGLVIAPTSPSIARELPAKARLHFDRIGLPDVHLHRFRAWFATSLLRAGNDIMAIRDLMRHESLATTQGYLLVDSATTRRAVGSLPEIGTA